MTPSKHLSENHLRGLEKLGDALVPGDKELPSFSKLKCVGEADRILDHMPASDLKDLKFLLSLLAVFPQFLVLVFIWVLELGSKIPGPLGAQLRFIRIGVRGLVMSLYYSDPRVHSILGYSVSIYTKDLS
ncbi:MAG: hypothetical protein AB1540_02840 [Bdellovibrionota bacterium]